MMKNRIVSDKTAYNKKKNKLSPERKKFHFCKFLIIIAFLFYIACVLYLVFFERIIHGSTSRFHQAVFDNMPYWQAVKKSIQYKPFSTIRYFSSWVVRSNPLFPIAIMNLMGNLALFFPMGFFLPYFQKKQRNLFLFFFTMIIMISLVEMIQALALIGKCDIVDLLLNLCGAFGGFICFQILYFLVKFLRKRVIYARFKK